MGMKRRDFLKRIGGGLAAATGIAALWARAAKSGTVPTAVVQVTGLRGTEDWPPAVAMRAIEPPIDIADNPAHVWADILKRAGHDVDDKVVQRLAEYCDEPLILCDELQNAVDAREWAEKGVTEELMEDWCDEPVPRGGYFIPAQPKG